MSEMLVGDRWDQFEKVSQIGEGVQAVLFGACDEREEDGRRVTAAFASGKKPVLSSDTYRAQSTFGDVVVDIQFTGFRKTNQGFPLVLRVGNRFANGAFRQYLVAVILQPAREGLEYGLRALATKCAPLRGVEIFGLGFDLVHFGDAQQSGVSAQGIAFFALEELSPSVGPAAYFYNIGAVVEMVVTRISIGLHVTFVSSQDCGRSLARPGPGEIINGVGMILVADVNPEKAGAAGPATSTVIP